MDDRSLSRRHLLMPWRWTPPERPATLPAPNAATPLPAERASYLPEPAAPLQRCGQSLAFLVRPPGALAEEQFLETCRRCGACVEACPVQAISPLAEGPGAGTPHIDTRTSPCQLCEGLQCTRACPSGALTPLEDPREVRMGTAVIDAGQCLAYRGAPCRVCVEVCPLPGVLELGRGRRVYVPVAGPEPCVGCGVCHRYCPAPDAIRIVPLAGGAAVRARVEPVQASD